MDTITAAQAQAMALSLTVLAGALDNCRFANWDALTESRRKTMQIDAQDIRTFANRLIQAAIGLTLADVSGALARIGEAAAWLRNAEATLAALDKVVAIGAAAVEIAAAGAAANPAALGSAVSDFLAAVANALPSGGA